MGGAPDKERRDAENAEPRAYGRKWGGRMRARGPALARNAGTD
jgi:hypothetical protein